MNNFSASKLNIDRSPGIANKSSLVKNISKTNGYTRSPSSSRILPKSRYINSSSSNEHNRDTDFRKTGSCHNLVEDNSPTSNIYGRKKVEGYNHQNRYSYTNLNPMSGNIHSSATNNSFGNHNKTSIQPSFYNGYLEKKTSTIHKPCSYDKTTSSTTSLTDSPDVPGIIQPSISHSSSNCSTSNSGIATNTYSSYKSSNNGDNYNKYNGFDLSSNHSTPNKGTIQNSISFVKSETTKSLNNSVLSPRGLVGLANLGNTCFMNSVLQCLSNSRSLQEYCISCKFEDEINNNSKSHGVLIRAYAELMKTMWKSDSESYVSPDKFRRQFQKLAPSFHGSAQQDSQEFLRIMLENLHQDVNRVQNRPKPVKVNEEEDEKLSEKTLASTYWSRYIRLDNSFIVDLFVGQLKSTLMCKKCGYKSVTYDPFWDLSLPIPKNRRDIRLTDCLDFFTSEELLEGDEMPKCARCKHKRPCSKSFSIQKFPPLLVIHLKRFSSDRYKSKISAFIDFPTTNLDLKQYAANTCSQSSIAYNLYGISNHSGSLHGGHYTAYCCNPYSRSWYEFNDTRVSKIEESRVCSSEAYVLFYELIQ